MKLSVTKSYLGFTLIEILSVIAIISLLLAILFPTLHKVRNLCQRMKCSNNLKQISVAWQMYLNDHNGKFLKGVNMNKYFGGYIADANDASPRPLNRYLQFSMPSGDFTKNNVFYCPSDTLENNDGIIFYREDGNSYQTNIYLIGPSQLPNSSELNKELNKRIINLTREAVTVNHSELLLMGDTPWRIQLKYSQAPIWHDKPRFFNMAFLDGHIDFIEILHEDNKPNQYKLIPFSDL